ncbi:NADPH dependent diflavin oxidoreductase 1 [Phakopsora pachyrhizi]|uniref:NADPH-dependent diflavin oxidoreductase 1 n=1 Tax=Phakopsora pachyrhizi TaxID=170000 RepID=A0AAV0BHJ2_PHAPC|nr:NADPH dependent diflavin oxidoreductase 1 [Phakopsora pachyrhizi]
MLVEDRSVGASSSSSSSSSSAQPLEQSSSSTAVSQVDSRRLLILYGSQTGSAEDVANQISRGCRRLHIRTRTLPMDEIEPRSLLGVNLVTIFVCSTTGQGVQPRNMTRLWKLLRRSDLSQDLFSSLRFTVFGLGDSSYRQFNWASRKLYRRILQLGGELFYERGEADDQNPNGIDSTLVPWLNGLWVALLRVFPMPEGLAEIPRTICLPSSFRLRPCDRALGSDHCDSQPVEGQMTATLTKNQRLTPLSHWQDTRHLEFDVLSEELDFEPGSVAELWPENDEDNVIKILELLDLKDQADVIHELSTVDPVECLANHFTKYATIRQIFKTKLDFMSIPKRSFIEWISFFCSNPIEKDRLQEFCSVEGQDDFHDYVYRPRRTILEVLSEFKSVRVPLDYIFEAFPTIRSRQYSISSSPKVHPSQVHLLVAVVKFKTRMSVPRKGLCTNWLSKLDTGSKVPIRILPGTFKFPKDPSVGVICIGPGTGIAPFRSLVQHRSDQTTGLNSHLIIYGCRNEDKDFYFRDEWSSFEGLGICRLHWAASRDQEVKRYVQDEIEEHGDEVLDFIENRNGSIFISGSSGKMPEGVRRSLGRVFSSYGGNDEAEAELRVKMLESTGRIQEETWS